MAAALQLSRFVATAVVQLDFDNLPASATVPGGCRQALVIVRRRDVPVAQFYAAASGGRLAMDETRRALEAATVKSRWRWAADDYLGLEPLHVLPPGARQKPEGRRQKAEPLC